MVTIPEVSQAEILARVGERSFERGHAYFRRGAVFETRRQGAVLKARCHGSQGGPYRLEVTLGAGGILGAHCSCPVGSGGFCKHVAALLLTWLDRPQQFTEMEELDAALERRSNAELIALVKQMLRQQPDLEWLLETPLPTGGKPGAPVDAAIYRRQAAALFANAGDEWEAPAEIAEGLLAIKEIGDGFVAQENFASGVAVYGAVLDAVLKRSESYADEEGALGGVIGRCIVGLGQCLSGVVDSETRASVLEWLWEAYRFDVNAGGPGFADEVPDLLLEQTTPEERRSIATWVRDVMPGGGDWSGKWRREVYGGLLLDLEAETLDDEAFLQICRETGRTDDLVDRLLSLGRVDEAAEATEQESDYGLIELADLFVQHGHAEVGERLMRERAEKNEDHRVMEWLKERYLARDDMPAALDLAERLFRKDSSLEGYQELRALAAALGRWEALRPELMALLRKQADSDLLVEVHLDEGEIDPALEVVKSRRDPWGPIDGMKLKVAEAAEVTRPREALEIYRQQAERLIEARGRDNYQAACRLLLQVRAISERLGEEQTWSAYINVLREQNRTLRALKEELAAAGL